MPTPLASRFVHLEIRVDAEDWCAWAASNGIAPVVLFFIQLEPTLLHQGSLTLAAGWPMASPVFNQGRNHTANPGEKRFRARSEQAGIAVK